MDRAVLEAVARADILISSVPWRHIGLSLLIAVVVVHVTKRVIIERGERHAVGDNFDRCPDMLGDGDDVRGGTDER